MQNNEAHVYPNILIFFMCAFYFILNIMSWQLRKSKHEPQLKQDEVG